MRSLLVSLLVLQVVVAPKCPPNPVPNPTPTPTPIVTTTTTTSTSTTTTTTTLPPAKPECSAPQGVNWTITTKTNQFDEAVNDAMHFITNCDVGSDCSHGALSDQGWLLLVAHTLRDRGFCSGQHENGITDEIAVACTILSADKLSCLLADCKTPWEGKHVAHFGVGKVVWCPGADRVSWIPNVSSCESNSPPVPTPSPTPSPTPAPSNCPVKATGDYFVDLHISMIGNNPQRYTATAKYCGFPVRTDVFKNCGTKCCTLGVDGGSDVAIACEQELSGTPVWSGSDTLKILVEDNPYNVKVTEGNGILQACGKSGCSNQIKF